MFTCRDAMQGQGRDSCADYISVPRRAAITQCDVEEGISSVYHTGRDIDSQPDSQPDETVS